MKAPKISVIVPVYNRAIMLKEALLSVIAQDWPDLEIIVVDDGSTDGSADIAEAFQVKTIRTDRCGYPGKVRNIGAEKASGHILAFLDSDDLWLHGKLSRQVSVFTLKDNPLIHCREIWDRNGKIISQSKQRHRREGNIFYECLIKCVIGPSTVLMDKKVFTDFGGFREDLEIAEDYEFWLRYADKYEVSYVDEPLVIKRAGDWPQLSEKYGMIEYFRIRALKDLLEKNEFADHHQAMAANILSEKCSIYSRGCQKRGKKAEAREYGALAAKYADFIYP